MTRLLQHTVSAPSAKRASEIAALGPWFHNLHLPDGAQTAPEHALGDFPAFKWREIEPFLPRDLTGWTALDIGCNAGFYTFQLARRGARVTGIDVEPLFLRQATWATREYCLERQVDFRRMQIYDLAGLDEQFDLVLFMGVFYHLRYPLFALDKLVSKVGGKLVFQTMIRGSGEVRRWDENYHFWNKEIFEHADFPRMYFIEQKYANDPTNWWIPNRAAAEGMLRSAGLEIEAHPEPETWVCSPSAETRGGRSVHELELSGLL